MEILVMILQFFYNLVSPKSTFIREIIYFSKKLKILFSFGINKKKFSLIIICLFQNNIEELCIHEKINKYD